MSVKEKKNEKNKQQIIENKVLFRLLIFYVILFLLALWSYGCASIQPGLVCHNSYKQYSECKKTKSESECGYLADNYERCLCFHHRGGDLRCR